jgi:hypothetical protein
MPLACYAHCVDTQAMKGMLSERTAATLVALSACPAGLRLAELARVTGGPLSSAQRNIESLLDDGLVVREGERRPRYRLAPDAPADALSTLAQWRLLPSRARLIRQQVEAMASDAHLPRLDLDSRLQSALEDSDTKQRVIDMAQRLIWWQKAEQSIRRPERIVAQVMAIGTSDDADFFQTIFGLEAMRQVLAGAPAGIFDARKWDYWHLRLGYKRTPPLPARPV